MILLIDNYDSFTFNLFQYFCELGAEVKVIRNDQITIGEIDGDLPEAIVISPGPCTPDEAGISLPVVDAFSGRVPILGVCLGHQSIVQSFGGRIVRAPKPVHGKVSPVTHDGRSLFEGIGSPFDAARYHSLVAEPSSLPEVLQTTAKTQDEDIIMAVQHREHPTWGVQFHPESILTTCGKDMLRNFMRENNIQTKEASQ